MPSQTHSEARRLALALYGAAKGDIRDGIPVESVNLVLEAGLKWANSVGNTVARDAYAEVLDRLSADALPRKAFSVDNYPAQGRKA